MPSAPVVVVVVVSSPPVPITPLAPPPIKVTVWLTMPGSRASCWPLPLVSNHSRSPSLALLGATTTTLATSASVAVPPAALVTTVALLLTVPGVIAYFDAWKYQVSPASNLPLLLVIFCQS